MFRNAGYNVMAY